MRKLVVHSILQFCVVFCVNLSEYTPMRIRLHSFLSFILIHWIYISIQISFVSGQCHGDEQSLLLQLKKSFAFSNASSSFGSSTKMNSWNNQSVSYCNWDGVKCDGEGHVIDLDLSGESISGGFDNSSTLFCLKHLQRLNLAENNFNSEIPSAFNKLGNLTHLNLSYAGFVGQIPIEISQLTRLVTLDLSSLSYLTGQKLTLENPNFRKFVQTLISIKQLYLDGVSITAQGQEWCNALLLLSNLQELSMSHCNLSGPLLPSLTELKKLSVVILDQNNLSSSVPEAFAYFKNLTILRLTYCGLNGTFPQKIFQVRTLSVIDISFNHNLNGSFPTFRVNGSLRTIVAGNTSFSGFIPPSIGRTGRLSKLDISNCQFSGTLPSSLSNLTELTYLDLSINNFTGPIPTFEMAKKLTYIDLSHNGFSGAISSSSHFGGLQNLVTINLGFNSISGSIPSSLFTLPSLQKIRLSNNQFSRLDKSTTVFSSKLNTLDLSSNNISGPVPAFLFKLKGLSILQLSSNKFKGLMQLNKLSELRNLTTLDLSYNFLSVNANVVTSSFPNISSLKLASCSLKVFPGFLRYQTKLTTLDLSVNQINGAVPNWIWKLNNLEVFNVSHNFLTELERPLQNLSSSLVVLDLHNNQLQGPIVFPQSAAYVDYSNNKFRSVIPADIGSYLSSTIYLSLANNSFSGTIPKWLCNTSSLQVLDLSRNNIYGRVPFCLMTLTETLGVLNLHMNHLSGTIPDKFPASCALRTLDLGRNMLAGKIPKSLANCSTLEVLDLGNNQISDHFPCLLKNIPTLRVLVLQNNKFYGVIGCPKNNASWHMLQIVDLAFNNFNGTLPGKCFTTWEAMKHEEDQADSEVNHIRFQVLQYDKIYYQDSVTVTSKGQSMELVKILTVFTSIDFSSNHFQGEIPKELFDFKALYTLNLSNNVFSGQIPSSIGNLKQLESLDLSNNSLEREIPYVLASLNFLSVLNLSFNHLVGMIPTGTQIQSFSNDSFNGNKGLCGPPLTANCKGNNNFRPAEAPRRTEAATSFDWQFISSGVGFGIGAGLVVAPLMIWERGRKWTDNCIDSFLLVVLPMFGLVYTPIHDDDDEEEDDTEDKSDMTDEDNCNEDEDDGDGDYPRFKGRYCVFCSKLNITMKRAIHDPSCTCYHHSSPLSISSHSSDSDSP